MWWVNSDKKEQWVDIQAKLHDSHLLLLAGSCNTDWHALANLGGEGSPNNKLWVSLLLLRNISLPLTQPRQPSSRAGYQSVLGPSSYTHSTRSSPEHPCARPFLRDACRHTLIQQTIRRNVFAKLALRSKDLTLIVWSSKGEKITYTFNVAGGRSKCRQHRQALQ